jgi:hypothetical protein
LNLTASPQHSPLALIGFIAAPRAGHMQANTLVRVRAFLVAVIRIRLLPIQVRIQLSQPYIQRSRKARRRRDQRDARLLKVG